MAPRPEIYTAYEPTAIQRRVRSENEAGMHGKVPRRCVVTGGTGFVGQRLVEMLIERGAERVVSFDIVPPAANVWKHTGIEYVVGNICDADAVSRAIEGADCVWHMCAAVGPFHPHELYTEVNVGGTRNVIDACERHGVHKLVFSSSPSTRFDGTDVDGMTEAQMPTLPQRRYVQEYAKTKADAELLMREAVNRGPLLAVAVAPHQVYGPRDNLFLPNLLDVAGLNRLFVFGHGNNRVCFSHVDNYCHGLVIAERSLVKGSPTLGNFYICTDGDTHPNSEGYSLFWHQIDKAVVGMGFKSVLSRIHLPFWFMHVLGMVCEFVGYCIGKKMKLNRFTVKMMTMSRWFDISAATRDLGYKPIVSFEEGWAETIEWFKEKWLPTWGDTAKGLLDGVASQTQRKIDIQTTDGRAKSD